MSLMTFIYNFFFILFIFIHLLVGGAITFGLGVYTGMYISQNYEVPRVDEPAKLWDKLKEFAEKHKKDK